MNSHILMTWLLTNLFHLIVLSLYFGGLTAPAPDDWSALVPLIIYMMAFSLPSLLLSFLAGYLISLLPAPVLSRFIVWLLTAPLIIILNLVLLSFLFGGQGIGFAELEIAVPALLSVTVVILVRYRYFLRCFETPGTQTTS